MKKLQIFDSIYFRAKSHFEEDGTQNYSFFQGTYFLKGFQVLVMVIIFIFGNLKDCRIAFTAPITSDYSLNPQLSYLGNKTRVEFRGSCSKQDEITYSHGKVVNIYTCYEISKIFSISSYATLENCLFAAVTLTKNADIDKNKYSGYRIRFDRH